MPRFVVLEHDHPELHWDLMLEAGDVLRTWRLHAPPAPGAAVRATASLDHRPAYLDYEGPVSGGRGHVRRWDAGTFTWEEDKEDRITVLLDGKRLRGRGRLGRGAGGEWSFVCQGGETVSPEAEGAEGGGQGEQAPGGE
jgi:hypothetical protein